MGRMCVVDVNRCPCFSSLQHTGNADACHDWQAPLQLAIWCVPNQSYLRCSQDAASNYNAAKRWIRNSLQLLFTTAQRQALLLSMLMPYLAHGWLACPVWPVLADRVARILLSYPTAALQTGPSLPITALLAAARVRVAVAGVA
jgi:hypothetical protein